MGCSAAAKMLSQATSGGGYEGRKQLDDLREVVDMIVVNLDVMLAKTKNRRYGVAR